MKTVSELKRSFASLVENAEPPVLSAFVIWLDVKLAEFKVYGYFHYIDEDVGLNETSTDQNEFNSSHSNEADYSAQSGLKLPCRVSEHAAKDDLCNSETKLPFSRKRAFSDPSLSGEQQTQQNASYSQSVRNGIARKILNKYCLNGGIYTQSGVVNTKNGHVFQASKKTVQPVIFNGVNGYQQALHNQVQKDSNGQDVDDQWTGYHCPKTDLIRANSLPNHLSGMTVNADAEVVSGFTDTHLSSLHHEQHAEYQHENFKITESHMSHCLPNSHNVDAEMPENHFVTSEPENLQNCEQPTGYFVNAPSSQVPVAPTHPSLPQEIYTQTGDPEVLQNGQTAFESPMITSQDHRNIQEYTSGIQKTGPPELIAFRDEEPIRQWKADDGVVSPTAEVGVAEVLSLSQTNGMNGVTEVHGVTEVNTNSSEQYQNYHFQQTALPDKDVGLDLSCKVRIIDASLNTTASTDGRQTGESERVIKFYKCQICGRIMLNSAGYNRHMRTHLKITCQLCGAIMEMRLMKNHRCTLQTSPVYHTALNDESKVSAGSRNGINTILGNGSPTDSQHLSIGGNTSVSDTNQETSFPEPNNAVISTPAVSDTNGKLNVTMDSFSKAVSEVVNAAYSDVISPQTPSTTEKEDTSSICSTDVLMNGESFTQEAVPSPTRDDTDPLKHYMNALACPICSKHFLHLSSLNRHLKVHQGVFTHACAVCGRRFTRNEHFLQHKCGRRPKDPNRMVENTKKLESAAKLVAFPPSMAMALVEKK